MPAPQTLPADFQSWDKPPDSLPADFGKWDQPAEQPSAISRLGHNFLSGLGVTDDAGAKKFFEHPIDTLMSSMNAQGELAKKAKDAYDRGDYKGAVMHGLNYLVPFIGQQTDQAGEQLNKGDIAGGIGRTLGVAASIVAGSPQAAAIKDSATSAVSDAASAAAGKVKPGLAKLGDVATAVGDSLDPDVVGLASPRAAHALRLAGKAGKVATKYGKPAPVPVPEAAADLDATSDLSDYAGERTPPATETEAPPAQLPAGFQSVAQAPPGSVNNPFQAAPQAQTAAVAPVAPPAAEVPTAAPETAAPAPVEAPPAPAVETMDPARVQQMLSEALGNKPLKPGVALKNQAAAAKTDLPDGFTPVQSSVLKGYKYNPATQEFDGITNTGQVYRHGEVTPDQFQKFEAADSKGKAWNELRGNSTPLGKVNNGTLQPRIKPARQIVMDENGRPEFSDVVEARKAAAAQETPAEPEAEKAEPEKTEAEQPAGKSAGAGQEDLTALLQQSLDQMKVPEGGVSTSADPAALTKRWGVDPESLASGREQTRGMTPEQTEAYINKLADAYKKGRPVEPVMETRDADNNVTEVDGRARAIAAQRAGIKRVPIIVRRLPAPVKK